jgi:cytochrome b561
MLIFPWAQKLVEVSHLRLLMLIFLTLVTGPILLSFSHPSFIYEETDIVVIVFQFFAFKASTKECQLLFTNIGAQNNVDMISGPKFCDKKLPKGDNKQYLKN